MHDVVPAGSRQDRTAKALGEIPEVFAAEGRHVADLYTPVLPHLLIPLPPIEHSDLVASGREPCRHFLYRPLDAPITCRDALLANHRNAHRTALGVVR